jgi:hypothetical protein
MDLALSRLLLLRLRGGVRYRLSQFATLRGATFLLVLAAVVWLVLGVGTSVPSAELNRISPQNPNDLREYISNYMPLGLFAAWLFTLFAATGPALHYSQNEINFLFAGPFRRSSLVIYKCSAYFAGAILSAGIFTLLIPQRASVGLAAFTGSLLTLLFIQLSSAAFRMFGHAFESSRLMRARQPTILLLLTVVSATMLYVTATTDKSIFDVLVGFRHSWLGSILLAPFAMFAELFLAQKIFPDLVARAIPAITINAALVPVIIALDGRTTDHSLSESRRLSSRWARIKQGASIWASDKTTGRSVRRSPVLGGLGPIIWRQTMNAVRNSGRVVLVFLVIAILTGPILESASTELKTSMIVGLLYFFIAFIMPRSLLCDFRGEFGSMELYKALPIAPWRICAGQLVVPVLLASAIELVMIFSTLLFFDGAAQAFLIALMAFTVPSNLLLYGLENLIFLLFPARLLPVGSVDFEFLGRALVDFILKTIIIVTAVVVAGAAGFAVLDATGQSYPLLAITSWLTLTVIGTLTVPLLGISFRRFKVSQTIE